MGNRADIAVEEPSGPRWEAAVEMLGEGAMVRLGSLLLYLERDKAGRPSQDGALIVEIPVTAWHGLTRERQERLAAARFEEAREHVGAVVEGDAGLRSVVADREITFELVDDYGNGAVRLATLEEGQVKIPPRRPPGPD